MKIIENFIKILGCDSFSIRAIPDWKCTSGGPIGVDSQRDLISLGRRMSDVLNGVVVALTLLTLPLSVCPI